MSHNDHNKDSFTMNIDPDKIALFSTNKKAMTPTLMNLKPWSKQICFQ